jgi:hypothetical protein
MLVDVRSDCAAVGTNGIAAILFLVCLLCPAGFAGFLLALMVFRAACTRHGYFWQRKQRKERLSMVSKETEC